MTCYLPWGRATRSALVRVTHASFGVTDLLALRGDYLLHPFGAVVPGYDFVGVVERLPGRSTAGHAQTGLVLGQRVCGILPRMGAHASHLEVDPALLVPVPERLASAAAATLPLDAVTAHFALEQLPLASGSVLIQGAGGAVGRLAVQLARRRGLTVYGTASAASRGIAERLGVTVFDYRDPGWDEQLRERSGGGVHGAIDHTGRRMPPRAMLPKGRIVRIAYQAAPGRGRSATALGSARTLLRRWAKPRERLVSVPFLVASQPRRYRQALAGLLALAADAELTPPRQQLIPFTDYFRAMDAAASPIPGTKTVLAFD